MIEEVFINFYFEHTDVRAYSLIIYTGIISRESLNYIARLKSIMTYLCGNEFEVFFNRDGPSYYVTVLADR